MPLRYCELSPGPALADAVECVWASWGAAGDDPKEQRILPDGCMDLLFDFGAPTGGRAVVVGAMRQAHVFQPQGTVDLLGVRFHPGELPRWLSQGAAELADRQTPLEVFWGECWVGEAWHRLAEAPTSAERARLVCALLASRPATTSDPYIRHCVGRLRGACGGLALRELGATTGLSGRQLERKFSEHIGLGPKAFARIMRFNAVVEAAEAQVASGASVDWADLAAEFGFSDQSHLVREVSELAGVSPTRLLAQLAPGEDGVGFLQDAPARI